MGGAPAAAEGATRPLLRSARLDSPSGEDAHERGRAHAAAHQVLRGLRALPARTRSRTSRSAIRATAIACMGNVAYWTGRKLKWDAKTWSFVGDAEANKHIFRPYRKPWDLVKFS